MRLANGGYAVGQGKQSKMTDEDRNEFARSEVVISPDRLWDSMEEQKVGWSFSRSIGDSYGKTRGLSSTADIVSIDMVERGIEYGTIIVASDGLWDVLSNEAVAQKIGQLSSVPNSSSVTTICTALAMHARSMDIDPDDLTLVVARVENQAYDTNDDTNHNE